MLGNRNFDFASFLLAVLPILLAITVREVVRGYTARRWGDPTAEQQGRLTLNPLPHIDPLGTLIVPAASLLLTGFLFGWAKPTPIDPRNFSNPRLAWRWVAASGPLSNLLVGFLWALALVFFPLMPAAYQEPFYQMAVYGVQINAVLFVLCALPVLPWDGGVFVDSFLNARHSASFRRTAPYGTWIALILMFAGAFQGLIAHVGLLMMWLAQTLVGWAF